MDKKHIICLVSNDLNYDQRMIRICSSLAEAGYQVTLVGRRLKVSPSLEDKPFRQKRLKCLFNKGKLFYIEYNIRLFFYLLYSKWDLVNAIDLDTILPALFSSYLKRKKCTYDAHEYFTEVPELEGRKWTKLIWEKVAAFAIPKMDTCYTVSPSLQDLFTKKYKKTFHVIRNVPFLKPAPSPFQNKEKKIILYQGALNKGRGLETAILAMKQLPEMELWLAGEGDLSATLRALAKGQSNVKFLGRLQPTDLAKKTEKAWLGLNLLEANSLNYYYSLANKFFDYMQAGVPSINNDFPEYRALINEYETGILLKELQVETLIKCINYLDKNVHDYQHLVDQSLKAKKVYNWANEQIGLLSIYDDLLSRQA